MVLLHFNLISKFKLNSIKFLYPFYSLPLLIIIVLLIFPSYLGFQSQAISISNLVPKRNFLIA